MSDNKKCGECRVVPIELPDDYDLGGITYGELKAGNERSPYRLAHIEDRDGNVVWSSDE